MSYLLEINNLFYEVEILRKNIKRTRLKVFPDAKITLTVIKEAPDEWIETFIEYRKPWIHKKLQMFKDTRELELEKDIKNGTSTRIQGRQLTISVEYAEVKKIEIVDDALIIYTPNIDFQTDINKEFELWWKVQAKKYFTTIIEKFYPILARKNIAMPNLYLRKMKTLWGSCSHSEHRVSLNFYLYKASVFAIDYVILHELLHFIYPKHNRDFYEHLTALMPDWKERVKELDYETVQGF